MKQATSRLPGNKNPGNGLDLLKPTTWLWLGPALIGTIAAARAFRTILTPAAFAALVILASHLGDAWEGRRRRWAGFVGTILAILGVGMWWPAPWHGPLIVAWVGIPPALAIAATRAIGQSGNSRRKSQSAKSLLDKLTTTEGSHGPTGRARAAHFLRLIGDDFTTGQVRMVEAPRVKYSKHAYDPTTQTLSIWFTCPQPLNPVGSVRAVTGGLSLSSEKVRLLDLHAERSHLFKITFTVDRPFAFVGAGKMPKPRPLDEAPDHHYEAGVDPAGNPIYVPLNSNAFMAGETRSGKTTQAKLKAQASLRAPDRRTIVLDFKKVDFAPYARRCLQYANTPEHAMAVLEWVDKLTESRLEYMVTVGWDTWQPSEDHPFIDVIVDECHDLFTHDELGKPAALLAANITARCSAAGIFCTWATQHPTAESIPRRVKVNCPVKVGFRVADGNACRAVLDEDASAKGYNIASDTLPQGRGVVAAPGHGRRWMQGHVPQALAKAEASPAPPPASSWPAPVSVRPSDPTPTPPTQGEHTPDGQTDKQTPDQEQAVLDALDPTEPRTIPDVMARTNLTKHSVHKTLQTLEREKKVHRPNGPNKGYARVSTH